MYRFTTTFARTLALFTLTSLVGCDELEDVDIDELEADDIELRTGAGGAAGNPIAGIPFDHHDISITFGAPLQVPSKFDSKGDEFGFVLDIHAPTNPAYQWTQDPTGAPGIIPDAEGDFPYSGEVAEASSSVCEEFLETYPTNVPVTGSLSACALAEKGCCDFICYIWGGDPVVENGQNKVGVVTNDTFELAEAYGKEMMKDAYVPTHMSWDDDESNGGHSLRERVCQCECTFEFVLEIQNP
jgi:hypothetical protein